ncbi:hypothetical protein [Leptospira bourretii]|uniref:hypothetical protein n=1 Tax=Leptospira bourretii TaxID=2484962 RepID=UPI00142D79CC|nr:hypothetical protein [Leptospira bourretii]
MRSFLLPIVGSHRGTSLPEHWKRILIFSLVAMVYLFWVFVGYDLAGVLGLAS